MIVIITINITLIITIYRIAIVTINRIAIITFEKHITSCLVPLRHAGSRLRGLGQLRSCRFLVFL